ncbi:hypothetical protein HZB69_01000 [Candidatus Amesbacteria bacterium]|nr:hypothetical protein [Candidatus Amesbacteria bacterium]
MNKKLNWVSIGISLATIHYGLGFLVGSGEAIYTQGTKGILYALASAVGLFSLILIAPFYLKKKYPIWDLMGNQYGTTVRRFVASLSGVWMVGVVASQILGGSWALSLFKINNYVSMIIISTLIFFLSMVNISKLSKIFFYMLMFSSLTLLIILFRIGVHWIPISIKSLFDSVPFFTFSDFIGIFLTTILVTFIGMDFHQFLVKAKDKENVVSGAIFGGGILIVLSILLLSVVSGSINTGLVANMSDAKQTVPSILLNFGNASIPFLGVLFSLPLVFVSIGSGSGVTRVVARTISDLDISNKIKVNKHFLTVAVAFLISLSGKSIINLIVSFYAIYVASVFIPFLLFW